MIKKILTRLLASLLGVLFLLLLLVGIELTARYLEKSTSADKNVFSRLGARFNRSTYLELEAKKKKLNPPQSGSWALKKDSFKKLDCSASSILKESQNQSTADKVYTYSSFTRVNGVLKLLPNVSNPQSRFRVGDKLIYDKSYSTDDQGRRKTLPVNTTAEKFLVFLGSSFIFGEGVNDDETLPSFVNQEFKSVSAYNYGTPGASLGAIYAQAISRQFREEIPEKEGVVLFFFFDFDLLRTIPTFSQGSQDYMKEQPFFEESNGKLELVSPERSDIKRKLFFYRLLGQSALVRSLHIDFPIPNQSHFDLYVKAVQALREKMKQDLGFKKFYVVALPDSSFMYFDKIKPLLTKANFSVIDFSLIRLENILPSNPYYECDGHPTVEHNKFMASRLLEALKADF